MREFFYATRRHMQFMRCGNVTSYSSVSEFEAGSSIVGQKSLQEHISLAYACLKMEQTSLSPNVQALLSRSIPSTPSPVTCHVKPLQSDMTLNWQVVERLLTSSLETGSCLNSACECFLATGIVLLVHVQAILQWPLRR